jgi:hypothetical protein
MNERRDPRDTESEVNWSYEYANAWDSLFPGDTHLTVEQQEICIAWANTVVRLAKARKLER